MSLFNKKEDYKNKKSLIIYFSRADENYFGGEMKYIEKGNTEIIAEYIRDITGADMPMGVYTFLDNYDLSGKRVAPFITHGGSGLSGTPDKIKREEPQATVTKGLSISGTSASSSENNVVSWLKEIGF